MEARTSINQSPDGGSLYPFVSLNDLQPGITDFYLAYDDITRSYTFPFTLTVTGGTFVVTDNANTVVATGAAVDAVTKLWGSRTVWEWQTTSTVMRAVTNVVVDGSGVLDARTCNRVPYRVTSLNAGDLHASAGVVFQAGYNIDIATNAQPERTEGKRYVNTINIDAIAGAGEGRVTGCDELAIAIRKINLVQPDCSGNFVLQLDNCFRSQLSTQITGAANTPRTGIYYSPMLSTAKAKASLKIESDCRPCCDCDYFVQTYAGLKRVWNKWKATAAAATVVRDVYEANRARWLEARQCRLANAGRLVTSTDANCKTFIGGSFCNFTACCIRDIEIRFTFRKYNNGVLVPWTSGSAVEAYLTGSPFSGEQRYTPAVNGPVTRFFVDYANPQVATTAKFKLCTTNCLSTESLETTMTVHVPATECDTPVATVPAPITAIWATLGISATPTVRSVEVKMAALNPSSPKFNCGC